MMVLSKIKPRLTSYDTVCATARSAPIRAYFEFEAHPEPKIEYTARLEIAKIRRMLRLMSVIAVGMGISAQSVNARVKASVGARANKIGEDVEGKLGSLMKSFNPSAKG